VCGIRPIARPRQHTGVLQNEALGWYTTVAWFLSTPVRSWYHTHSILTSVSNHRLLHKQTHEALFSKQFN
jgi:hypothetical protein